jgi:hypothetical protein
MLPYRVSTPFCLLQRSLAVWYQSDSIYGG